MQPESWSGLPTGPQTPDHLLRGAVDLHHHGFPEFTLDHPTRLDDAAELAHARAAGMAGIVLKSHFFPTTTAAWRLNRELGGGIEAFPSITLNPCAGGFSPLALEAAARQGARVVYMPTWGAANDIRRGGISRYIARYLRRADTLTPERGLTVTDEAGRLRTEVSECLAVAAEFGTPSSARKLRPSCGATPSSGSVSWVTRRTLTRSGSPRPVTVAEPSFQSPTLSKTRLSSRYVKYSDGAISSRSMLTPGAVCHKPTSSSGRG